MYYLVVSFCSYTQAVLVRKSSGVFPLYLLWKHIGMKRRECFLVTLHQHAVSSHGKWKLRLEEEWISSISVSWPFFLLHRPGRNGIAMTPDTHTKMHLSPWDIGQKSRRLVFVILKVLCPTCASTCLPERKMRLLSSAVEANATCIHPVHIKSVTVQSMWLVPQATCLTSAAQFCWSEDA